MVFSSIPAYLDPANWQQQPNHHHHHYQTETVGGSGNPIITATTTTTTTDPINPHQLITSPSSSSSHHHHHNNHVGVGTAAAMAAGMGSSIRPGSMAERARLANIPLPEAALKCPRCESTNTKFCYFNNYSLTQPRHFCKTCRRYWTRGGALRNVPVGGGCRRNKRSSSSTKSSSSNSKSPISTSTDRQTCSNNNNSSSTATTVTCNNILGLTPPPQVQLPPPLRFLSPLSQLTTHHDHDHYMSNSTHHHPAGGADISLNYNGISPAPSSHEVMNFQLGTNFLGLGGGGGSSVYNSLFSNSIEQQWRLQQTQPLIPNIFGGLDSSNSAYHQNFQGTSATTTTSVVEPSGGHGGNLFAAGETSDHDHHHQQQQQVRPNYKLSSSMLTGQMASIKMEYMNHELNLSRQLMGINPSSNDQQWTSTGAAAWTDLSSFSSSSTSNPL